MRVCGGGGGGGAQHELNLFCAVIPWATWNISTL